MIFHPIYLCLKQSKVGAFLTDSGILFQILGPEYARHFRKISKFGLGMNKVESDIELKFAWWMVFSYVNVMVQKLVLRPTWPNSICNPKNCIYLEEHREPGQDLCTVEHVACLNNVKCFTGRSKTVVLTTRLSFSHSHWNAFKQRKQNS